MDRIKSQELFQRATKTLVGGVNSPVRSFRRVGGSPVLGKRGEGPYLFDVDENRYVDFVMSYGPHLFGHAQKKIVSAVQAAAANSSCLGLTTEGEIEWAELVLKRLPGSEKIRAVSTGTEATSTAIRLARGITGRSLIVKCAGHYHGSVDSLLVDGGSGLATLALGAATPDSKGLPQALTDLSRVVEFNDLVAVEALFAREGTQIAGMIIEPIMGNMGVVPPKPEYLKKLRELCTRHGALLIFDEVMTGLRVHRNSAQGRYGVQPDLTCLGKVVGGGMALAAVAGPAKFMDHLAPLGGVYQAGTLSGNPVAIAGGLAMLKLIDEESPYEQLEECGARFELLLREETARLKIPARIERVGSMLSLYFREGQVLNARDCRDIDEARFNRFFWKMLDEGFMLPPSPFEAWFLAVPHLPLVKQDAFAQSMRRVFSALA